MLGSCSRERVHCDQLGDAKSGGGALLQQTGHGRVVDQEGKQAVKMTRLSCHRFRSNQVRLALSLLVYSLGNLRPRLGLSREIENWSLTKLAATFGEDRKTTGQACTVLLATAGKDNALFAE